ncbi:MAG TPA: PaaI family thioesterase [Candidatus Paceibacterota bacterium]|nr:PaaI family thioesterase [Verrucomicrobiota bacterium]HSA11734.1 PaaI family thioesterase [Candidatus Paceibacterota bacterium]
MNLKTLPHTRSCFVCGEANPAGLNLRFETDGRRVQTRFVPRAEHVGFRQTVHGGLIATLLDEIMVWACAVRTKRFAYCAELKVRFIRPVRPNEALVATGELVCNRRDKLFEAGAELRNKNGETLATATGKYFPVKQADLGQMVTDFVDDPGWLFEPQDQETVKPGA